MFPRKTLQMAGIASAGSVMAALLTAMPAAADPPSSLVPCDPAALVSALTAANSAARGGQVLLTPGCTYTLTGPASPGGEDGLPPVTAKVSVVGVGSTIARASTAPAFRLLDVAASGDLTVSGTTLTGGGPPGDGGGLRNAGRTALYGVVIRGNTSGGQGGGIANSGTLAMQAGMVSGNTAATGGGIANTGTGTIRALVGSVNHNTAKGTGGSSATGPGGILNSGGSVKLTLTTVYGNTPTNCAGSPNPVPGCAH